MRIGTIAEKLLWHQILLLKSIGIWRGYKPNHDPCPLPGSLWAVTCFFNPENYTSRLENLLHFSEHMKHLDIPVICVEVVQDDASSEIPEGTFSKTVTVRCKSILWQKEAAWNKAMQYLPDTCDKVLLLDADVLFSDKDIKKTVSSLLEKFKVIQPFSKLIRLSKEDTLRIKSTASITPDSLRSLLEKKDEAATVAAVEQYGRIVLRMSQKYHGNSGFAWAARKSTLESAGIYDAMIFGSGDKINCFGYFGIARLPIWKYISKLQRKDIQKWVGHTNATVRGSVSYSEGTLLHLWHGDEKNKMHNERLRILKAENFNPKSDVQKNTDEMWEWAKEGAFAERWYNTYFTKRKEDA